MSYVLITPVSLLDLQFRDAVRKGGSPSRKINSS